MTKSRKKKSFVVCLSNDGYAASLEPRKIYVALRDAAAERNGLLRVVDESGDDYLYSRERFAPLKLPRGLQQPLAAAAEPWPFRGQVHSKSDPARWSDRNSQKHKGLICPRLTTRRRPVWTPPRAPGLQGGSDHFVFFRQVERRSIGRAFKVPRA